MAIVDANTRSLEERIKNLEFQNRQEESQLYAKRETLRVAPLGVRLGDLPASKPEVRIMLDFYFNFFTKTKEKKKRKKVFLRKFVLTSALSSLSLDCF